MNPWLHPWAYQTKKSGEMPPGIDFTAESRARIAAGRFLYMATRVDGESPNMAKALVDNAVYATRYLTPGIGAKGDLSDDRPRARSWGDLPWSKGSKGDHGPKVGLLERGRGFWGDLPTVLPGGASKTVISSNVVKPAGGGVLTELRQNATFGAGGAAWSPHITNVSWWDDDVLWPLLLSGRALGDALQQNMAYQGWITTFYGDPLYRPDQARTAVDRSPPRLAKGGEGCSVRLTPAGMSYWVEVRCEVENGAAEPEVAQIRVSCTPEGGGEVRVQEEPHFLARPTAVVRGLRPATRYAVTVELQDPYGNRSRWEAPAVTTGALLKALVDVVEVQGERPSGPSSLRLDPDRTDGPSLNAGQLDLELLFDRSGDGYVVGHKVLGLGRVRDSWFFNPGGSLAQGVWPVRLGEPCRLRLVWSRDPVVREVYGWTEGRFRRIAAENRAPWRPVASPQTLQFSGAGTVWRRIEARVRPD